jgi:hypothetical protein
MRGMLLIENGRLIYAWLFRNANVFRSKRSAASAS